MDIANVGIQFVQIMGDFWDCMDSWVLWGTYTFLDLWFTASFIGVVLAFIRSFRIEDVYLEDLESYLD